MLHPALKIVYYNTKVVDANASKEQVPFVSN
jgi:hypothetical protein